MFNSLITTPLNLLELKINLIRNYIHVFAIQKNWYNVCKIQGIMACQIGWFYLKINLINLWCFVTLSECVGTPYRGMVDKECSTSNCCVLYFNHNL